MVGAIIFRVVKSLDNARKQFQGMNNRQQARGPNGQAGDDHEMVIDRRSPEEASRKIIANDEGEYIDFEDA